MPIRLLVAMFVAIAALPASARVVRIEVEKREKLDAATGYEKVTGRAFGELDPRDRLNAIITDLNLAPRNARGNVEYSATFTLLLPVDRAKLSGVLIYEVPN